MPFKKIYNLPLEFRQKLLCDHYVPHQNVLLVLALFVRCCLVNILDSDSTVYNLDLLPLILHGLSAEQEQQTTLKKKSGAG